MIYQMYIRYVITLHRGGGNGLWGAEVQYVCHSRFRTVKFNEINEMSQRRNTFTCVKKSAIEARFSSIHVGCSDEKTY